MLTPGSRFRAALAAEKPLQLTGVINAYAALLARRAGFRALYLSGAGVANHSYGVPDTGITERADVLIDARRITRCVDLPLLVDIDTGWDDPERTVREMEEAGVAAVVVAVPNLAAALEALRSGQAEGVIGDSLLLAQRTRSAGARALALTPNLPYERYAVACVLPENDSSFRNLANLAIARLLQGYLDGQPAAVAAIDPWVGPPSALKLSQQQIRAYFETVLLGVEAIRPLPAAPASAKTP